VADATKRVCVDWAPYGRYPSLPTRGITRSGWTSGDDRNQRVDGPLSVRRFADSNSDFIRIVLVQECILYAFMDLRERNLDLAGSESVVV